MTRAKIQGSRAPAGTGCIVYQVDWQGGESSGPSPAERRPRSAYSAETL
jgi:hypothetical protein